ncbi:MAG: hypothetical protein WA825_12145 [Steroidobacteraceae bacterium]
MRPLCVLMTLALLGTAPTAQAANAGAFVTPSTLTANLQSTLPTMLTWTVQIPAIFTAAAGGSITLVAPQGLVTTPNGTVLQVDPTALTVRVPPGSQASVAESFTLAPATIAAALQSGVNTLTLTRTFLAANYKLTAQVTLALGGSASGPLTLARVSLHFDDRQLIRVAEPGEIIAAIAEINFSGSGTLNGIWEVASPPSTRGQPVFVPLGSAAINLQGGGLTEVTSPPLPSLLAGTYLVRFRVRDPVVPFSGLVLPYAVEDDATQVPPVAIISPEQHATLAAGTRFQWQPAAGAVAYRLEFYEADSAEQGAVPISGEWLPAAQRDAALSALAQTHLKSGQAYRWRIVAVGADAEILGRSAFYEILTP